MSYLIKITDKVNNSHEIISCETSLESYNDDYTKIYDSLNSNKDLTMTIKDKNTKNAIICKYTTIKNKGYLYNTTSKLTTVLYELSLIKINTSLSSLFVSESSTQTESTSQTESNKQIELVTHSETQLESELELDSDSESESESQVEVITYGTVYDQYKKHNQYPDNEEPFNYSYYNNNYYKPQVTVRSWSPLLMDELKTKLSLPNAGLTNSSNCFFLD